METDLTGTLSFPVSGPWHTPFPTLSLLHPLSDGLSPSDLSLNRTFSGSPSLSRSLSTLFWHRTGVSAVSCLYIRFFFIP